jgi:hypothetical protein
MNWLAMTEVIHKHPTQLDDNNTKYTAHVCAAERADGTWYGWIEFHPADKRMPVLRTDQETSQPSRVTIEYWALGLEPVYFEGALARAQGRLP